MQLISDVLPFFFVLFCFRSRVEAKKLLVMSGVSEQGVVL